MEQAKETNVLDIIIALTNAIKKTQTIDEHGCQYYLEDGTNRLWGAKYLLNQVLRQYGIKEDDHIFISVAADKRWREITDGKEKIENYHYTKKVTVHKECELDLYKGASNQPEKKVLKPNDTFQYRQVFHDEHVIPINDIIQHLIDLKEPNYEDVQNILNNIYMCRMLKSENIGLPHKGRSWNVAETINTIYRKKNIEIVGFEEKNN